MSRLPEDKRLTEYRRKIESENFADGVRGFCGLLGLFAFFLLAFASLVEGTGMGLFSGGLSAMFWRFSKFSFFLLCFWGLLKPVESYFEQTTAEKKRREEALAKIEEDRK